MSVGYRKRFGLSHDPLPRDCVGETFYSQDARYEGLRRIFLRLAAEPGLGLLTGLAGSGKTAALRNLCEALPQSEYRIVNISGASVTPADVYRTLAVELGLTPASQRDVLWRQLKGTLEQLVDVEGVLPLLVFDEAQQQPDSFFLGLASFLNFNHRELLTVWLVGLPSLAGRLRKHAALASRLASTSAIMPALGREDFVAMVEHGLKVAGAKAKVLSEPAIEQLWRISHGLPRQASRLLRASLVLAHEREQSFVDEYVVLAAFFRSRGRGRSTEEG